jgi:hypothetical protein
VCVIRREIPTFDSRVILLNEMALDESNRQSGLAHSYPQKRNPPREKSELGSRKHVSERKRGTGHH